VGDRLLEQIAARVRSSLRDSDTLARFGGDEFVVLLPRCGGASDAAKVGDNILALLNRPFDVDGHMLSISGSMGYALYPDSGVDEEQLLRCADQSMYHAKSQGQLALGEAAEAAGLAR
jgi:diguanylate cyclase (GGDEF)-like protein